MQADQSLAQQHSKSKGHGGAGGEESDRLDNASALHGVERVGIAVPGHIDDATEKFVDETRAGVTP